MREDVSRVVFVPRSTWQEPDCLAQLSGCRGNATIEARIGNAAVRSCENKQCRDYAAEEAIRRNTNKV